MNKATTENWVSTWTGVTAPAFESPAFPNAGYENQTLRQMVTATAPAKEVRIRVSNRYGDQGLAIGNASIGVAATPHTPRLIAGTSRALTFGGQVGVTIPAGKEVVSDPVAFDLLPHQTVGIDLYFPQATGTGQYRSNPIQASYLGGGNLAGEETRTGWDPVNSMMLMLGLAAGPRAGWLVGLEQPDPPAGGCIVIAGDSTNFGPFGQWLYRRLRTEYGDKAPAVVERTISGQAAVHSSHYAPSLLDTFEENILSVPGVKQIIVNVGTNDFVWLQVSDVEPFSPATKVTENEMLDAFKTFAQLAHERGIQIIACTIMNGGATELDLSGITGQPHVWTAENDENQQLARSITTSVNDYLRDTDDYDGLIDFNRLTANRLDPSERDPFASAVDNVHGSPAGQAEWVRAADLAMLMKPFT